MLAWLEGYQLVAGLNKRHFFAIWIVVLLLIVTALLAWPSRIHTNCYLCSLIQFSTLERTEFIFFPSLLVRQKVYFLKQMLNTNVYTK